MIYVVIAVLSLVLLFPKPPFHWLSGMPLTLGIVALATLLPALLAWPVTRGTLRRLDARPDDPDVAQSFYARWMHLIQLLTCGLHALALVGSDWITMCRRAAVIGAWPGVPGVLAAVPLVLAVVLLWIATYPADRAIRQIALEINLHRGRPAHPIWSLGQFIVYSLRHQLLFILIPMALILVARDVIDRFDKPLAQRFGHRDAPDLLLGAVAGLVAIIAPSILRHVWVTQPLPESALRARLLEMCRRLRMRCREILVWRTGGMIVNAAVMGVIAPLRYVMITDGMLEQMDDRKIEAVFGHESGHVKRHHIAFFLLYAFITGCLLMIVAQWSRGLRQQEFQWLMAGVAVVMGFKWLFLFGWISRHFERQADVFGVRTLALGGMQCDRPCALHDPQQPSAKGGDPLCQSAAHVFADTLHEVALLNGIAPEAKSWRHGSIQSRSITVQRLAHDPAATASFERRICCIKAGIFLAAVASAAWAVWELKLWRIVAGWF